MYTSPSALDPSVFRDATASGRTTVALFLEWNLDFSEETLFRLAAARSMDASFLTNAKDHDIVVDIKDVHPYDAGRARVLQITGTNVFAVHALLQGAGARRYHVDSAGQATEGLLKNRVPVSAPTSEALT